MKADSIETAAEEYHVRAARWFNEGRALIREGNAIAECLEARTAALHEEIARIRAELHDDTLPAIAEKEPE